MRCRTTTTLLSLITTVCFVTTIDAQSTPSPAETTELAARVLTEVRLEEDRQALQR